MWLSTLIAAIVAVALIGHFFQTGIKLPDKVKLYRALAVRFAAAADAEVERRKVYAAKKKEYSEAAWDGR